MADHSDPQGLTDDQIRERQRRAEPLTPEEGRQILDGVQRRDVPPGSLLGERQLVDETATKRYRGWKTARPEPDEHERARQHLRSTLDATIQAWEQLATNAAMRAAVDTEQLDPSSRAQRMTDRLTTGDAMNGATGPGWQHLSRQALEAHRRRVLVDESKPGWRERNEREDVLDERRFQARDDERTAQADVLAQLEGWARACDGSQPLMSPHAAASLLAGTAAWLTARAELAHAEELFAAHRARSIADEAFADDPPF